MTTTTNYPESPEGSSPANCPHCGAELIQGLNKLLFPDSQKWECGSWLHAESGAGRKTDLCRERAARQKAEAEVEAAYQWMREVLTDWKIAFDNHSAGLKQGITQALFDKNEARQKAEAERDALKKMLDREEREHSVTVKQRDDAETAAARLAEVILGVDELNGDKHVWWARAVDRYNEIEQQLTASLAEAEKQLSDTRRKLEEAIRFVWGAVHNAKPECGAEMARWVCVRNALGVGSTTATALCREHGVDPDEVLKSRCTYTEEAEKGGAS